MKENTPNPLAQYLSEHKQDHEFDYGSVQYRTHAAIVSYAIDHKLTPAELAELLEIKLGREVVKTNLDMTLAQYVAQFYDDILTDDEDDRRIFFEIFGSINYDTLAHTLIPKLFEFEKRFGSDLWSSASIGSDFCSLYHYPTNDDEEGTDNSYDLWYETAHEALCLYSLVYFEFVPAEDHLEVFGDFDT